MDYWGITFDLVPMFRGALRRAADATDVVEVERLLAFARDCMDFRWEIVHSDRDPFN